MSILNICNNADVLSTMRLVKITILIIRIATPIILILSLMIGYVSAIKDNDQDALNKVNRSAVSRIIAALLVFFIPMFVNLIADVLDHDKNSYISCIKMATKENINQLLYEDALKKIQKARETLADSDYNAAATAVNKVKEHPLKYALVSQLNEVKEYIKLKNEILELIDHYNREKYLEVVEKVEKVTDPKVKAKLKKLLEQVGVGTPLNVKPGLKLIEGRSFQYYEIIPPNPMTNMPLIISLHGDGGFKYNGVTSYVDEGKAYKDEEFFYIAPHPNGYTRGMMWDNKQVLIGLKAIIDDVVNKYEIDKDRIIITGYSRGAIGTWDIVNMYPNFFSAAVPISCGGNEFNPKNFRYTSVWAIFGDKDDELIYAPRMKSRVENINKAGGYAIYTQKKNMGHGSMGGQFKNREVIKWALSQKRGPKK